jgi:hypothetical protein
LTPPFEESLNEDSLGKRIDITLRKGKRLMTLPNEDITNGESLDDSVALEESLGKGKKTMKRKRSPDPTSEAKRRLIEWLWVCDRTQGCKTDRQLKSKITCKPTKLTRSA